MFGNQMASTAFNNQVADNRFSQRAQIEGMFGDARNQAIQEQLLQRNQPLQELLALLGRGNPMMPQFGPTPAGSVAPTNVGSIMQNADAMRQNIYGQQMGSWNSTMGGLGQLIGMNAA
jgi:hypothetical protein